LDGETTLKIYRAIDLTAKFTEDQDFANMKGFVRSELPNSNLLNFKGKFYFYFFELLLLF